MRSPWTTPSSCTYTNPLVTSPSCRDHIFLSDKIRVLNNKHTSPNRSASGSAFTNSLMLPLTIHSDTITNRFSDIVTPNSGNTFGWWRVFHATTSLQNLYKTQSIINADDKPGMLPTTHSFDVLGVVPFVYLQNLGCDLLALVSALPYPCKSTKTQRVIRWIVTKWNHQRPWK